MALSDLIGALFISFCIGGGVGFVAGYAARILAEGDQ